ncbi:MAG: hypothetical protein JNG90_16250 [Planctomycetaceae bacterium]|nr:hypothetical protein [Planctomycetaceae bacterium]
MKIDGKKASRIIASHRELQNAGFIHAVNVGHLDGSSSYSFADGVLLRRASAREIQTLQRLLKATLDQSAIFPPRNPYQTATKTLRTNESTLTFETRKLPRREWRYHVIEFSGNNCIAHDFADASTLTRHRIRLGSMVMRTDAGSALGWSSNDLRFLNELKDDDDAILALTLQDVADIRDVYDKLRKYDNASINLRDAITKYQHLDLIPFGSPMRFLGYMAIVESLITHRPDPSDPYSSLTRQVRQKMLLLDRRARIEIPYGRFGKAPREQIWNRLYEYRSTVAHGAVMKFGGKFECLKDAETVTKFLERVVVAVMRLALDETQLVADLKAI